MTDTAQKARPPLRARLWRRISFDTGVPDLIAAASQIKALVLTTDQASKASADTQGPINISKLAEDRGVSKAEIERQLWNRQRMTKWRARVFGLAVLYCGIQAALVIATNADGADITPLVAMLGMTCLAVTGLTLNAFTNWQVRERRLERFQTFLQHPAHWWPR